jgi:hypothetical protein
MELKADTISALAAVIGVVVSMIAITVESWRSRSAHQVSLILDFNNRFNDEWMVKKRKIASEFLLHNPQTAPTGNEWGQVSDVLDFFQTLGTFAKSGYVSTELLYKFFYFWFSRYWKACESHVKQTQLSSPITWSDAEWLYQCLYAYDQKHNTGALNNPDSEQLNDFFKWEIDNHR